MEMRLAALLIILIAALGICAADELDNHRITVDFQDAELAAALKMMFSQAGVSYALGEDVRGLVTAHIENLPLSDALRAILSPRGFVVVKYGDTYTIHRKTTAEETPKAPAVENTRGGEEVASREESKIIIEKIPLKYIDAYELAALIQGTQGIQTQPREYRPIAGWNTNILGGQFGQQFNLGYPQWNYGTQPYTNPWQPTNLLQPTNPNSRFDIYNQPVQRRGLLLSN
jgi:hypothetical protein